MVSNRTYRMSLIRGVLAVALAVFVFVLAGCGAAASYRTLGEKVDGGREILVSNTFDSAISSLSVRESGVGGGILLIL